jgi:uncharacterized phage protein gp47/JayE
VLPQESALLAGALTDLNAAFGGNLNITNLFTPQGQLASSEAACIGAGNDLFAFFVSQVNPDNAQNFMQDAIARIYFLTRNPGVPTSVQCPCGGLMGTVIPVGALAQDTSGNTYACTEAGTISASGTITLPFANQLNGPIACPANTVTQIYQAITGWESITNAQPGVAGANVETTAAFAYRRQLSVAINAQGSTDSMLGAVFAVPGVIDAYVVDNPLGTLVNYGSSNYPLLPNSVYVGVVGGSPQAIAQAIWTKKDLGCNYNGNTTVQVQDTSGFALPYPTYNVTFNIPNALPIYFSMQIQNNPSLPSNIVPLIQNALVNAFTGADGTPRARLGGLILASTYYPSVAACAPNVNVYNIGLTAATPNNTTQYFNFFQCGIDQAPTCLPANVAVTLI